MDFSYTTKDDQIINAVFRPYGNFGQDIMEIIVDANDKSKNQVVVANPFDENSYFRYNGELIRANDYNALTVNKVCDRLNKKQDIGFYDLLHTFTKYDDMIGVVKQYKVRIQGEQFKIICLLVPYEGLHSKEDWAYKIDFKPYNTRLSQVIKPEELYFSTVHSRILKRELVFVHRIEFLQQYKDGFYA